MSEPLSLLEGRASADAAREPGEVVWRFWRDQGLWHVQYGQVVQVPNLVDGAAGPPRYAVIPGREDIVGKVKTP